MQFGAETRAETSEKEWSEKVQAGSSLILACLLRNPAEGTKFEGTV